MENQLVWFNALFGATVGHQLLGQSGQFPLSNQVPTT